MVTSVAVVSLWAEDVPAAVHFYQDVSACVCCPMLMSGHTSTWTGST